MSYLEVLGDIEARGLSVSVTGGDLRLQGLRDRIDQQLVSRIKEFKPEIIAHLSRVTPCQPGSFPLTPLQHGYLLGRSGVFEIGVASHVYHEIEGVWDLDRLELALLTVVRRHDALRSSFSEDGRQVVAEPGTVRPQFGRLDLRGRSSAEQRRTRLALRAERSHRVLPADGAPLLRVDVTILADDLMVLQVSHDGLVMDGISSFLFFRAWWQAYQGTPDTGEELPLEDYVAALDASRAKAPTERSRAYWSRRLEELPPHPDLPLGTSPSAITEPRFTQRQIRLAPEDWSALKDRAKRAGLTPSGLLMAGYAEVLSRWGAGSGFTLNTTVANRPPIHHRILEAIGPFSDTMLVEVEIDRALSFEERARALQARLRTALDHRHHSGVEVQRELGRRRGGPAEARMPFTFNSAIGYALEDVDGSALELFGPEVFTVSQTPQVWLNAFAMEQHGALVVQLDGLDELFPEGLLDDLSRGYQSLLEALAEESAWSRTTFDLLPVEQRRRRRAVNDTKVALPDRMLQDAFTAQALRTPDAAALITSQGEISYGELHRRAAQAAAWLRMRGWAGTSWSGW